MSRVLNIEWAKSATPPPERDSTTSWDQWFTAAADPEPLKTWGIVKQVVTKEEDRCRWAKVLELNRLRRFYHKQEVGDASIQ